MSGSCYMTPARVVLGASETISFADRTRDDGGRYTPGGSLASPEDFQQASKSLKRKKLRRVGASAGLFAGGAIIGSSTRGRAGLIRAGRRILAG